MQRCIPMLTLAYLSQQSKSHPINPRVNVSDLARVPKVPLLLHLAALAEVQMWPTSIDVKEPGSCGSAMRDFSPSGMCHNTQCWRCPYLSSFISSKYVWYHRLDLTLADELNWWCCWQHGCFCLLAEESLKGCRFWFLCSKLQWLEEVSVELWVILASFLAKNKPLSKVCRPKKKTLCPKWSKSTFSVYTSLKKPLPCASPAALFVARWPCWLFSCLGWAEVVWRVCILQRHDPGRWNVAGCLFTCTDLLWWRKMLLSGCL